MSESLCGAFSGFVQTIVSHPLDTIKTRIQCNNLHYHGLYKGCMPNLLTNMTQNSMLFSCHSYLYNQSFDHFTSGVVAGSLSSLLINPLELWKIRLQNNKRMCFFSESFKGLRYTFMRDSIGVGIYFFSYHGIKESYDDSFMCGGIAGVLSWVYSYPFDVMKSGSRIMTRSPIDIYTRDSRS